ncbi:UDP-glucose 4-epimerase [Oceanotoga teriensis]|uniref:UDP-glucose 4-epimerase n=1 Tax=Oceanotoga teriensis TaxID=515440 RepID=A0AA45HHZ9_9BACT|nr:SDR family oxidoreductase [Oceanotoga teriensis]PWJ88096.1 UDP-glucose 4-epimerase [Oceanotoga teriensis]
MLYLITGAKGYVGSKVKEKFLENNKKIEEINFDLSENSNFTKIYDEEFIILHIAGEKSNNKNKLIKNNIVATSNVVNNLALQKNCKGIIYVSSISVFGLQDEVITEKSPYNYDNYYGFSKFISEKIIVETLKNKNYYILRPTNIYSDHKNNLIGIITEKLKSNEEFEVWLSSLETKRDYMHLEKVAEIIYKASLKLSKNEIKKTINVAQGKSYNLKEIIEKLEKKYNKKLKQKIIDNNSYRSKDLNVDNKALMDELDYKITYDI